MGEITKVFYITVIKHITGLNSDLNNIVFNYNQHTVIFDLRLI